MKRQTLFLLPFLLGALVASVAIGYQSRRASRALDHPDRWRQASVLGLTLDVPTDISAPSTDASEPWTAVEFRTGVLGSLRIAREQPRGDLQAALQSWFELPGPLDRAVTYRIQGQPAQARPVTAFGPAGHFVRRRGRQFVAVCVFDLEGRRYWVQARANGASPATLACFDRVLLSLRGPRGARVDPGLARDLSAAEAGLAPGLVQDLTWTAAIPIAAVILVMGVIVLASRQSGKAPRTPEGLGGRYAETSVEVLIAFQLQRKYFDAALAVTDDRLVLYTFGTPFLTVPLDALRGKVTEGSGWFGPRYLELALEGALDYRKLKRLYGAWKGRTRLRIYTKDYLRLRMALGA